MSAYKKLFGKEFDAVHYGQTKLIKVLEAIPDTIRVRAVKWREGEREGGGMGGGEGWGGGREGGRGGI